jgi:hypothetical protein
MSILSRLRSMARQVEEFNNDEDGMETIQVVMLLGLAAVVAVLLFVFWKKIRGWFKGQEQKFDQDSKDI